MNETIPLAAVPEPFSGPYPLDGTSLGSYTDLQQVGRGGMGGVYRAYEPAMSRQVALKVCHPGMMRDADGRSRFEKEISILAQLQVDGVVRVFGRGVEQHWHFYAMELVPGKTLRQHMTENVMPGKARVDVLVRLASILAALHAEGVCHRDIKPENIMLRPDGQPVYIDFGIARLFALGSDPGLTRLGTRPGSLQYMSPDKPADLGSSHDAWCRADVYSLAAVGYEWLSGQPALHLANLDETEQYRVWLEAQPEPFEELCPDLDPRLAAAIMKALSKEWRQRDDAAGFAAKLAGDDHAQEVAPARERAALTSRRLLIALVALVAVLVATALYWMARGESASPTTTDPRPYAQLTGSADVRQSPSVERPAAPTDVTATVYRPAVPLTFSAEPTIHHRAAPPHLQAHWERHAADAALIGRGTLVWSAGPGDQLSIYKDGLMVVDCRPSTHVADSYSHPPGARLAIHLTHAGSNTQRILQWQPEAGRVDSLY